MSPMMIGFFLCHIAKTDFPLQSMLIMADKKIHMCAVPSGHNFPWMAAAMRTEIPFIPCFGIIKVNTGAFVQPVSLSRKSLIPAIRIL